jgi:Leucine-rich repeat (LRR) protein
MHTDTDFHDENLFVLSSIPYEKTYEIYKEYGYVNYNGQVINFSDYLNLLKLLERSGKQIFDLYIEEFNYDSDYYLYGDLASGLLNRKIVGIHLRESEILTEIPPEINNLTHLKILNLRDNAIEEINGLDALVNLNELDLRYNAITEIKEHETLIDLNELDFGFRNKGA